MPMNSRFFLLLSFAVLSLSPCMFAAESRDLILVAGQSNAVGYDALPGDLPPDPLDRETPFWWRVGDPPPDEADSSSGKKWSHLQVQPRGTPLRAEGGANGARIPRQYGNFKSPEGGFGPEMGMVRELKHLEKKPVAVVKVAFSGTGMRTDWNSEDPGEGGACYRALVEETRLALAAARAGGMELRVRAFVWIQGESDANARDASQYEASLGKMLESLRRDLKEPQIACLLSVNPHFGNDKNPFMETIVAAQRALAEKLPRCAYVDNSTAETLKPSQTHFTGAGTLQAGRAFARALLEMESHTRPKDSIP